MSLARSLAFSIEWRAYALVLTFAYFHLFMKAPVAEATIYTLGLQALLLLGHTIWLTYRKA